MKVKVSEVFYGVATYSDLSLESQLQDEIADIEKALAYETSDCSGHYVLVSHSLALDENRGKGLLTTIWQYKRV